MEDGPYKMYAVPGLFCVGTAYLEMKMMKV